MFRFLMSSLLIILSSVPVMAQDGDWGQAGQTAAPEATAAATAATPVESAPVAEGSYTYEGLLALGHAQYMAKNFDAAIARYKDAKAMDAGRGEAYYFAGCAMIQKQWIGEAVATFKVAAEVAGEKNPELHAKSLFAVAIAWERQRDLNMAKQAWGAYKDFAIAHATSIVFVAVAEQQIELIEKWEQRQTEYQIVRDRIAAETAQ